MEFDNQNGLCKTTGSVHHAASSCENSQTGDAHSAVQNTKLDAEEPEIDDEDVGESLQHVPPNKHQQLYPNIHKNVPVVTTSVVQNSSATFQQVLNFSPAYLNLYYGSHGTAPGYSLGYPNNNPLTSGYLLSSGFPQMPSAPGFLTGAGYHFSHTGSPILGGLRVPGSLLLPPGQTGTPLHSAAIVGDKQKLAEILQDNSINLEVQDRWGRVPLVYAVMGNNQEAVEALLRAGARPDATDSHSRTALHYASYKGHLGCIKAILHAVESKGMLHLESQGGVWLAQDVRGVTPLHHAAVHSNHKYLQALLKYAAPGTLDTEDHKKRTPLHWAAAYGSEENVRLLIKHGANNLTPDQEGKTPLHWAAMSRAEGAKDCVRILIGAAPSSVNWQDFDGITALHLAVAEARKDTVDVILSVPKCNVDLTDNQFRTALHWACNRGLTAIVGRLLEQRAHPGAVDVYGATPLHYAAQLNHADTVELLVRRPCVRDDPSKEGYTALLWAAARGADSALTVMVRHGASLSQADPRGCTALHIAAGAGHVSTVGVLLRLRAPFDVCASDGRTPLLHAAQAGHAQIVKILAKAGASLDHRDNEGQCALHHAVLSGHLYLAQILIRAGTSVNVQDYSGRTPLHMAAYRGLSDIMFLLLENRGDVNARDHQGQSPLHWAAQQGHLGAVNTLLDFHAYPNYTQTTVDRYTPLDCAYVAEQLEVAQVLMEAGGLSVTRIMEIAATRIQALMRGYIIRKHFRLFRGSSRSHSGKNFSDKTLGVGSSFVDSLMSETKHWSSSIQSETSDSATYCHVKGSPLVNSDNSDTCGNLENEEVGMDSKIIHPAQHTRGSPTDSSLYNSVSGQQHSRALASSIMRNTAEKTLCNLDQQGLSKNFSDKTLGVGSSFVDSLMSETKHWSSSIQSETSDSATYCHVKGSPLVNSDNSDTCGNLENEEVGMDSKIIYPAQHLIRGSPTDSSPYNSVSGQRRSKVLASSIMRGARKKTLRNLELPELIELGIGQMKPAKISADADDSDSEDRYAVLSSAVHSSSFVMAQVLQHSSNIASSVAPAGVAKPTQDLNNTSEESDKVNIQRSHECDDDDGHSNSKGCENEITNGRTQNQKVQPVTNLDDVTTRKNNENVMRNAQEWDGNRETCSSNIHNKERLHPTSARHIEAMKLNEKLKEEFYDDCIDEENNPCDDTESGRILHRMDRRQILQEKAAKALSIAEKQDLDQGNFALRQKERQILSADTRKHAEEKWNNKLASLTLQTVSRPHSSKAVVPFSYNLVSPPTSLAVGSSKINTHTEKRDGYNASS
ncbi:inversin-like isoform X2 [Homarus americanus]|uniref:inversin-like isoform X2 n=1 Tax=Homarus americanus TaxID=6706 RepID=UPI001C445BDD|nr:inversin-like isoform X2 [Homarus americanus]